MNSFGLHLKFWSPLSLCSLPDGEASLNLHYCFKNRILSELVPKNCLNTDISGEFPGLFSQMNLKKTEDSLPAVSNPINFQVLMAGLLWLWMCIIWLKKKKIFPVVTLSGNYFNLWHSMYFCVIMVSISNDTLFLPSEFKINLICYSEAFHIMVDYMDLPLM